jgi:hypothetical protein
MPWKSSPLQIGRSRKQPGDRIWQPTVGVLHRFPGQTLVHVQIGLEPNVDLDAPVAGANLPDLKWGMKIRDAAALMYATECTATMLGFRCPISKCPGGVDCGF